MSQPTGIFPGMTRAAYDKIDALNISLLIEGERSMQHLKYAKEHPAAPTPALIFGQAVHVAVYEPERLQDQVAVLPELNARTNEGKALKAKFLESNAGKVILDSEDYAQCMAIRDAVRGNPVAREILDAPGKGEVSFVWRDEETGILCKGRLDRFCRWRGYSVVSDLKTCEDAGPEAFSRAVAKYGYYVKSAWYLDGMNALAPSERRFVWLATEKESPHATAIYEPDDEALAEGRRVYRQLLNRYAECVKTGTWPGYPVGIEPLALPRWAFAERTVYA